ncbi:DNA repair exonuclease [Sulfitobacter sp. S190]|uniref:metallophosphoesterase family protein n=1 Tax=Sulfitobacter sp. S190 TaxID=2867022 RepID=UPI0021A5D825|nr:DNA repair exonuclease [Sulfitobacter sp. S190]UWR21369.1 DNA repair exonuclease [Sulfitobacter sp. S190]
MIRFLHSSDLHLGKPFGRYPEDVRGRLRQARHGALDRLAQAAREGGAGLVLLAGDTFDQETPNPAVVRQALNTMAGAQDIRWVLMPGNHDSLAAAEAWRIITRDKPENVILALDDSPLDLSQAWLLPAPCTERSPGRDLTRSMDQPSPEGAIRIGLGHGGIVDFQSMGDAGTAGPTGVIPPDRAEQSGLAYLALGDWHGQMQVTPHCWYSGTPERDSFRHAAAASALLVTVEAAGAQPQVSPIETGAIDWQADTLDMTPDDDPAALLERAVPAVADRRDCNLRLRFGGRARMDARQRMQAMLDRIAPDFLSLDADLSGLALVHDTDDLDAIDPTGGALRLTADRLVEMARDPDAALEDRRVADAALSLLFGFAAQAPDP